MACAVHCPIHCAGDLTQGLMHASKCLATKPHPQVPPDLSEQFGHDVSSCQYLSHVEFIQVLGSSLEMHGSLPLIVSTFVFPLWDSSYTQVVLLLLFRMSLGMALFLECLLSHSASVGQFMRQPLSLLTILQGAVSDQSVFNYIWQDGLRD